IIKIRKNKKHQISISEKAREFAIRFSDKSKIIEYYREILNLTD
mgnify:CR=1